MPDDFAGHIEDTKLTDAPFTASAENGRMRNANGLRL